MAGWLGNLIALHRSANNSVEYVSYKFDSDIYKVQITAILLLPVSEFLRILVSLDERYGINLSGSFIESYEITFPRADKEELINFAYFKRRSLNYDYWVRRVCFFDSFRTCQINQR